MKRKQYKLTEELGKGKINNIINKEFKVTDKKKVAFSELRRTNTASLRKS